MGRMLEFLKELLDEATAPLSDVTARRAFGSWGYYVDDRIFALAYAREDRLGVKLPDAAAYATAKGLAGASDWAPHGSPMADWVLLPADLHDDRDAVRDWVVRAYELVRAAPATTGKKPVAKKPAAKKPAAKKPAAKKPAAKKPAIAAKKTAVKKTAMQATAAARGKGRR